MDRLVRRLLRQGSLPQLTTLEAVVQCGSVTLAGERLHLAQPTISGHLRKLTDTVGCPLVERRGGRLQATAAGEALVQASREIRAVLERMAETLELGQLDVAAAAQPPLRSAKVVPFEPLAGLHARIAARGARRAEALASAGLSDAAAPTVAAVAGGGGGAGGGAAVVSRRMLVGAPVPLTAPGSA